MSHRKPPFERSIETQLCLDILLQAKPDEVIAWGTFENATEAGPAATRSYVYSARQIIRSEHNVLFTAVRGKGIRRVLNDEIPLQNHRLERIRRTTREGLKDLSCAEYEKLNQSGKTACDTKRSVYAVLGSVTKPKTMLKLQSAVEETKNAIPIGNVLRILGKNGAEES